MRKIVFFIALLAIGSLKAQQLPFTFDAKGILVLSDADMVSSAYIDGILKTEDGVSDALTVIQWDSIATNITRQKLNVPNSVTNWVDGLDVSNDRQVAFVIDTKKALPRSIQKVDNVQEDLPKGNMLYAIDISDLTHPRLIDKMKVGLHPLSVDVHPKTGDILVINRDKGHEVYIIEWKNNQFGKFISIDLEIGADAATHASWHPSEQYFGLTLEPSAQIAFFRYDNEKVISIGAPVKAGSYPGASRFSQNGDYYLVPDLNWDKGYDVRGSILSIKFSEKGEHSIRSTIEVGVSPEGFAISPAGNLIAVSNMGTNFMPMDFPLFGQKASISLLAFDENDGSFELLDTKEWEGILPEGITFDADGDMLAITSFDYLDLGERRGGISFWEITSSNGKRLLKNTGFKISVTRGSHYVRIVE